MQLYLQCGYGMMQHCIDLIEEWGEGTAILSPRDMTLEQMQRVASQVMPHNGSCLFDPQMFAPRCDHNRLTSHDYWPENYSTNMFFDDRQLEQLILDIWRYNEAVSANHVILPSLYCESVDADWIHVQESVIDKSNEVLDGVSKYATICLSNDVARNDSQIDLLVDLASQWNVDGIYLVAATPNESYLTDDPVWLSNIMSLSWGMKSADKTVIYGYGNHQMLCLACARVDAIAAGTWLNVRSFSTSKFWMQEEDSVSRRTRWYYCPQSLSEYKIPMLDIALRQGVLSQLYPPQGFDTRYCESLFSGVQPSSVEFGERDAFRHYLTSLRHQCALTDQGTYRSTLAYYQTMLNDANTLINRLHNSGVRGGDRDFSNVLDMNLSALTVFNNNYGFQAERMW